MTVQVRAVARATTNAIADATQEWDESPEVSAPRLARCYESCLRLAKEHSVCSIVFPAISCGVYGYPIEQAAEVAIETCRWHHGLVMDLRFVLYGYEACERWTAVADKMLNE